MTEVAIGEITTGDSGPHDPPYRISGISGKDTFQANYTPSTTGDTPIRAIRVQLDGSNRNDGTDLERMGIICGSGDKCGSGKKPLALTSGTGLTLSKDYQDTGPASDGDHDVNFYVESIEEGWG